PVPHFVVFYNGNLNAPEHEILRLSDAFEHETDEPELELICHVYNINKGNNTQLLEKCATLREYMYFVDLVRDNHATMEHLEEAIQKAIDQCIRENVLKDFLKEYGAEVMHMMTLDFTFERRLELQREEALEEGREEGREEGIILGREELIRKKILKQKSLEQIADELEETPDEIRPLYDRIVKEIQKQENNRLQLL
ncbi:MAG: transposase, partial [bacterium]|nr:transposase [bacterium]